jgi:DNA topoisomerase-1
MDRRARRLNRIVAAETSIDPVKSATLAGLRYLSETGPGILRRRAGSGFVYIGPDGKPVRDEKELARIRALVIPPAWTNVWICPDPNGHIQAVGRDAKGRKQYRYHARYRQIRDRVKFDSLSGFCEVLPQIRRTINADLARQGLPREKVLATVVRLLETTYIRIGNEEYARENESYGLTTLRNEHVEVSASTVLFRFRGKSGVHHEVKLNDRRLARIIQECHDLPGQDLFEYVNGDGELRRVGSAEVNQYLREITGQDFTAKEFRTWSGTVLTARELDQAGPFESETEAKRKILAAIKSTAQRLGNKPSTCRAYYVHPRVLEAYMDRELPVLCRLPESNGAKTELSAEEVCVWKLISSRSSARPRRSAA